MGEILQKLPGKYKDNALKIIRATIHWFFAIYYG